MNFSNDAFLDSNSVQLTKNQAGTILTYSVGSATYSKAVHLWDKASVMLANFATNFTFSIKSFGNPGDGLAFFLSPFPFERPKNISTDGTLRLFKDDGKNISENQIVAVEFDTFQNKWYNVMRGKNIIALMCTQSKASG